MRPAISGFLPGLRLTVVAAGVSMWAAPPTAADTRVQEWNPLSVRYEGTWHANVNLSHSDSRIVGSTEQGARAIVTFQGTGIRWVGFRDEWSGHAGVYLDGVFIALVDTYMSPAAYQATLLDISGLPPATHILEIQVLDTRNAVAGGAWVTIDAFDFKTTPGGPPSWCTGARYGEPTPWCSGDRPDFPPSWAGALRQEQDSPNVGYSGFWHWNTLEMHSGGSATLSVERDARATFSFDGTGVRWIGYRDEGAGIARVYLDGALVGIIDTYATPYQAQAPLFETSGLPPGPHTLAIEVPYVRNAQSRGRGIWVDAFDVVY